MPTESSLVEVVEKLLGAKTEVVNYCTKRRLFKRYARRWFWGLAQLSGSSA